MADALTKHSAMMKRRPLRRVALIRTVRMSALMWKRNQKALKKAT